MINRILHTIVFCCALVSLQAQQPQNDKLPCGTPAGIDPWLMRYNEAPWTFDKRSSDTLYVGIQVHFLGNNNGGGYFNMDKFLSAFCRLNEDFGPSGIQFYLKNDFNYINNTAWYNHSDIETGIDMMLTNNYPDVINCYFVADPAGNCGYNLPYAGVAVKHSCANPDDHTWTHEVGHNLSMPHTFIGWEGKSYSYNAPTPELVTYDYTHFHDTLDPVPAPLDTALVEKVDGSNCTIAADLFCDTPPDYLSYRWDCDGASNSLVKQKDQDGNDFYSDGTLFMSYAFDHCQNRFSDEEIAAMRANLLSEKSSYLGPPPVDAVIAGAPQLLQNSAGEQVPPNAVTISWAKTPGATRYYMIGSRLSNFALRDFETITSDTSFTTGALVADKTYYWKVRAFNDYTGCSPASSIGSFVTAQSLSAGENASTGFRCFPSLIFANQRLNIEIPESWLNQKISLAVYSATGQTMLHQTTQWNVRNNSIELASVHLTPGSYQVTFVSEKGTAALKFFVVQ